MSICPDMIILFKTEAFHAHNFAFLYAFDDFRDGPRRLREPEPSRTIPDVQHHLPRLAVLQRHEMDIPSCGSNTAHRGKSSTGTANGRDGPRRLLEPDRR